MMADIEDFTRRPIHREDDSRNQESEEEIVDERRNIVLDSTGARELKKRNLYPNLEKELVDESSPESKSKKKTQTPPICDQHRIAPAKEPVQTALKDKPSSVLLVLALIAIVVICAFYFLGGSGGESLSSSSEDIISEVIERLESDFKHQTASSMKVIKASLKPVVPVRSSPARPAIITLISSRSSVETAECFAWKLASYLNKTNGERFVYVDGKKFSDMEPSKAKKEIDENISNHFQKGELNVALVSNLDEIPADAAMIFHGYCDDTNAQFKKAVYIMTVTTTEAIPDNAGLKEMDKILATRLQGSWSSVLDEDQLRPLLTRLTVSPAAVLPDNLPKDCHSI